MSRQPFRGYPKHVLDAMGIEPSTIHAHEREEERCAIEAETESERAQYDSEMHT